MNFIDGNTAIAWGAFDAGCRFFAGYPITPATGISETMLQLLPPANGIAVQGEDEIASIGLCIGASMSGTKVMTATSGPGISLYSENISFAIGSEIPMVIVNVQRLGPSTGSATRGADGDIQFMRWSNTGGLPAIVLAPEDAADCYVLTRHAFNLAERFRCPVFIATNKEIGLTRESVDLSALPVPAPISRVTAPDDEPYVPFRSATDHDVPYFLPIGGDRLSRQTSSTHGEDGYITTSSKEIGDQIDRLERKLVSHLDEYTFYEEEIADGAEDMVITYGVSARSARDAVGQLRTEGKPASLVVLKTLWPVPEVLIVRLAKNHRRIFVVEMNQGQYIHEIERVLCNQEVSHIGHMNGNLVKPELIKEAVNG